MGRLRRAGTVTALAPAGLWRMRPLHMSIAMRQFRLNARLTRLLAPEAPQNWLVRGLSMVPASGKPFSLPYEPIRTMVHDLAEAPGFRETLRALETRRFEGGADITVPVTVAFGSRDIVMLPWLARWSGELPDHTRWVTMPGCGHLQVFDDPSAVVDLVLASTKPDRAEDLGGPVR